MEDKVIIFFTRIPTLGKTKTRLETFLSKEMCVKLQAAFIRDIYNNIKDTGIDIIVNYSDHGDLKVLKNIIDGEEYFLKQEGEDLGEKMHNAISFSLKGYKRSVLIGSDIPLLDKKDIEVAFKILETNDIAIAPTYDGGYHLIGMKEADGEIFNIEYSTRSVFQETIDKIKGMGKTFGKGNAQLDIDDKADLLSLHEIFKSNSKIDSKYTREVMDKIMEKCDKNAY